MRLPIGMCDGSSISGKDHRKKGGGGGVGSKMREVISSQNASVRAKGDERGRLSARRSKNVSLHVGVLPGNYVKRCIITWRVCVCVCAQQVSYLMSLPPNSSTFNHHSPLNENERHLSLLRDKMSSGIKLAVKMTSFFFSSQ